LETRLTESTWWWLLCGALIATELLTGTFLLLMLAAGALAGALVAHLGFSLTHQMVAAATIGASAVLLWFRFLRHTAKRTSNDPFGTQATGQVNLDLGQTLSVTAWNADGMTQVHYRGAPWAAKFSAQHDQDHPKPGLHRICDIQGNVLIVQRVE
jgi:membrane protein implicated in regulation of membrane protease activity